MRECLKLQMKARRVIESCVTLEQLKVAERFANRAVHGSMLDFEDCWEQLHADHELADLIKAKKQNLKQGQNIDQSQKQPPAGQEGL